MEFLSLPFMRTAFLTSLLAGNALAFLGLFVLMRRVSFAGLAVSQLAALGGVFGLLIGHFGSFGAALVFVCAGLLFLVGEKKKSFLPPEARVATLYIFGAAIAVLILAKAPLGEAHTLNIFFGNVLTLGRTEVWESAAFFVATVLVLGTGLHRWIWISFDPSSAQVAGLRMRLWTTIFFLLFAFGMTITIHLFGVLLAFAYLVLPAAISLIYVTRMRPLFILLFIVCTLTTTAGFWLSFRWDLPTGPSVAALLAVTMTLSALFVRRTN